MKTRGWRHPLSKKTNARAAGPLPGLRGKLVIAALALALALAPVGRIPMKTRGWRHPLSKKTNARAAGPLPGLRGKLVIAALALALALAPVGTYAGLADAAAVPGAAVSGAADWPTPPPCPAPL